MDRRQPIRIYLNYDAVGHSADRDCRSPGEIVKVREDVIHLSATLKTQYFLIVLSKTFFWYCWILAETHAILSRPGRLNIMVLDNMLITGRACTSWFWFIGDPLSNLASWHCVWCCQLGEPPPSSIPGLPACNSHIEPPVYGDCWYNCTLEDISGEDKKSRLHEVLSEHKAWWISQFL